MHISYDSEREVKEYQEQDPVKRVYFYSKKAPWKAEPLSASANASDSDVGPFSRRSNIMIPKTFVSRKTRLYSSKNKSKEDLEKLKK